MTASHTDDTESDNSGVVREDIDVQALHRHIRNRGGATLSGLSKRLGVREDRLRELLRDLESEGVVTVEAKMHAVHVDVVDDEYIATDGGFLSSLLGWDDGDVEEIDLSQRTVYNIISNERRRRLIRFCGMFYSDEKEVYLQVKTLSGMIPVAVYALRRHELTDELEERCYTSLVQTHLPMLDDAGVIEYYERPKKIRLTETGKQLADLITEVNSRCNDDPWHEKVVEKTRREDEPDDDGFDPDGDDDDDGDGAAARARGGR